MFVFRIGVPVITDHGEKARISVDIKIDEGGCEEEKTLWYEVDAAHREYLYADRVDPFLVAVLPYCMKKNYNIQIAEETGVSADLLYQILKIMLPALGCTKSFGFHVIDIKANPIYETLKKGTGIATGMSRGIDSFYTILKNLDGLFPLTSLTLFNVQSYGEYGGEAARKYFNGEAAIARNICGELNDEYGTELTLVTVDSNVQDMLPIGIHPAGPYRDAAAVLLLKQMFQLYYFAADVNLDNFDFGKGIRRENPWIFYCLSTENYRIQLFGAEASRIEKAEYISRFPVTYDNLRVCLKPLKYGNQGMEYQSHINCTCDCDKCRYTVMELAAADKLEKYKKVFDLDRAREKYTDILAESIMKKNITQPHWRGVYEAFRQRGEINDTFEREVCVPQDHDQCILKLMDRLLQRIPKSPSMAERLREEGWQTVAIYGMGRLGKQLYCVLKENVVYEIDRNKEAAYGDVPLKGLQEEFPPVDLIIITTVYEGEAIREFLQKKVSCKVMTLAEILDLE